ncbi:urea carboxylase-associated family protein [Luminiphilus sp.]|nr:urea amidolyase associated protein UAAP1 [Luminiphilus sp.]MDA9722036.1 urea carboxylase-associated family protein [Luminiphilus sp.]
MLRDQIDAASHWSMIIRRGTVLRLADVEGGANAAMLFYNPYDKLERYNAPDSLKCQHTLHLSAGNCLFSDMGRIFCSIIRDELDGHDTVCGNLSDKKLVEKYAARSFQEALNERTISGEYAFAIELAKHGLGERDHAANANFFSKAVTDEAGNLRYLEDYSGAGKSLDLRFEMDTLVLIHTCPHPLNPAKDYVSRPVGLELYRAQPVPEDDMCVNACEENRRGFQNNAIYHLRGGY